MRPSLRFRRFLIGISLLASVAIVAVVVLGGLTSSSEEYSTATSHVPIVNGSTAGSTPFTAVSRPAPIVYRPPGLSFTQRVPLVIGLYGADGCPQCMEGLTKFEHVADEHGFVVAYPGSATSPPWNSAGDLTYLKSLIAQVEVSQNIDPTRIYVAGFSGGGRMTYYLGCVLSRQIAAIAVVSSVMRQYPCPLSHPVSELTLDGSTESNALYGTSTGIPPAAATAARWRGLDGCSARIVAETSVVAPVKQETWGPCVDGSAVALYVLAGGIHTWPGTYGLRRSSPDAQYNASEAIWSFFAAHARGSLTQASASLLTVRTAPQRRIVVTLRLGESVGVKATLVGPRHTLASKNSVLFAGASVALALVVPGTVGRGHYQLRLRIRDAYGRFRQLVSWIGWSSAATARAHA
jgi:polyhydroxybutyrate depolymerase